MFLGVRVRFSINNLGSPAKYSLFSSTDILVGEVLALNGHCNSPRFLVTVRRVSDTESLAIWSQS